MPRSMPTIRSRWSSVSGGCTECLRRPDGVGDELELAVPVAVHRRLADAGTPRDPLDRERAVADVGELVERRLEDHRPRALDTGIDVRRAHGSASGAECSPERICSCRMRRPGVQHDRAGDDRDHRRHRHRHVDGVGERGTGVLDERRRGRRIQRLRHAERGTDRLLGSACGLGRQLRDVDVAAVRRRHDAAEDGDTECAAELARRVVDRRSDAGLVERHRRHDRPGRGRHRQRHATGEQHERDAR